MGIIAAINYRKKEIENTYLQKPKEITNIFTIRYIYHRSEQITYLMNKLIFEINNLLISEYAIYLF